MELKNRSFQYGKVSLEARIQKTSVTVCAQSGHRLHGHTRVVEHATVKLLRFCYLYTYACLIVTCYRVCFTVILT